jgi:hypothetical protein
MWQTAHPPRHLSAVQKVSSDRSAAQTAKRYQLGSQLSS